MIRLPWRYRGIFIATVAPASLSLGGSQARQLPCQYLSRSLFHLNLYTV